MTDHFHARGRRPALAARCWRQAVRPSLSAVPLAWGLMGVAVQGLRPWRKIMRDVLSHDRLHGKVAVSVPSSAHGTPRAQVPVPMLPCARKAFWCHATCRVHRGRSCGHAAITGCRVCGTVRCHGPWSVVRGVGVPVDGARSSVGCCPARSSAAHSGPLSVPLHLSDLTDQGSPCSLADQGVTSSTMGWLTWPVWLAGAAGGGADAAGRLPELARRGLRGLAGSSGQCPGDRGQGAARRHACSVQHDPVQGAGQQPPHALVCQCVG